jgi:ribosomal 50S subunit-recycling heat shock protein
MRLDKFLKVSRLIRRRAVAKSVAEEGRCRVNGRPAKPSTAVSAGDRVVLDLPRGRIEIEVLDTRDAVPAAMAASLYRVVEDTAPPT